MEYAIGYNLGKDRNHNAVQMTQCTDPRYNGKVWYNNEQMKEPGFTAIPYLVKFDPDDQFCYIVPLETVKAERL